MKYLLDTNHWSYLQEGRASVVARVAALPDEAQLCISVISQGELLAGIEWTRGLRRKQELRQLYEQTLSAAAELIPITPPVATHYALVWAECRRRGRPIPANDVWLAASALAFEMTLVSADSHFNEIPNLRVENWLE